MLIEWMEKGGPVMVPLLIVSVVALTVVAERFLFWLELGRNQNPAGLQRILDAASAGRIEESVALGQRLQHPVARVLVRGLEQAGGSVSSALELQVQEELRLMRRNLGILETLITLAPLLGIYGTITGIIRAFGFLAGAGIPDPQLVAAGIAEALITTAAGLTIAILAIPPYNFFSAKTEQVAHEVERHATHLELILQRNASHPPASDEGPG